jgi:hypothetical protein
VTQLSGQARAQKKRGPFPVRSNMERPKRKTSCRFLQKAAAAFH